MTNTDPRHARNIALERLKAILQSISAKNFERLTASLNQLSLAKAIGDLPRGDLVAGNNGAVVRRASLFIGATDLSQEPFIKVNFGDEEHSTLIKGLLDRYRADAGVQAGAAV